MVCVDNTVVIQMRACDRGKSEARGARSAEGAPCEGRFVVRVRSCALTAGSVPMRGMQVFAEQPRPEILERNGLEDVRLAR